LTPEPLTDPEAERAVLGGILLDNEAFTVVDTQLAAGDFAHPAHGVLYEVFGELDRRGSPIDIITVSEALRARDRLNTVGGAQYLGELTDTIPTVAHIASHASIVADLAARRRVRDAALQVALRAADGTAPIEAVADAGAEALQGAARGARGATTLRTLGDALDAVTARTLEGARHGFPLPWPTLDRSLRGLRGGRQYVIAGLTSMGKSTLVRNLATSLAAPAAWFAPRPGDDRRMADERALLARRAAVPVLFFALEMPVEENSIQVMASCIGASGEAVERGALTDAQINAYTAARNVLDGCPLRFDGETEAAARICALARQFVRQFGRCVVIIDYLQLCDPSGLTTEQSPTRERQVASMSRAFKRLAMRLDVPVIVLSQLSRRGDRDEACPKLSDLRESGAVEQDADAVLFLWGKRPKGTDIMQEVNCTLAKVRGGCAGVSVPMVLHRASTRFEESPDAMLSLPIEEPSFEDETWLHSSVGGDAE
jgi:replicative DNA helicase